MTVLTVGTGEEFKTLSAAVAASQSGDTIEVKAGTYTNDFPETITHSLTIEGIGGMVDLVATEPPPSLKAIIVVGNGPSDPSNIDVTIKDVSFEGAQISEADGGNAAGIKLQSGHLTVNDDYFAHNQMGLLTGNLQQTSIVVENSVFAGQSTYAADLAHQLYIGQIGSALVENNLFLADSSGNQIKDRAAVTTIAHNTIDDGTGHTSYDIDLPNGGQALVEDNTIVKGADDPNTTVIEYGAEGMIYSQNSLTIEDNVIDNQLTGGHGILLYNFATDVTAQIDDNEIYNILPSKILAGPGHADESGNVFLTAPPTIDLDSPITTDQITLSDVLPQSDGTDGTAS